MTTFQPIDESALKALLFANRSLRVRAYGRTKGWWLMVKEGVNNLVLVDDGGHERLFSTLEQLDDYLSGIGIPYFLVDTSALDETSNNIDVRTKFNEAKECAAHDKWVGQKIQEALDDPWPSIPHSEVQERAAARRLQLLARLEKEKS